MVIDFSSVFHNSIIIFWGNNFQAVFWDIIYDLGVRILINIENTKDFYLCNDIFDFGIGDIYKNGGENNTKPVFNTIAFLEIFIQEDLF